jgi:hypothetical protein
MSRHRKASSWPFAVGLGNPEAAIRQAIAIAAPGPLMGRGVPPLPIPKAAVACEHEGWALATGWSAHRTTRQTLAELSTTVIYSAQHTARALQVSFGSGGAKEKALRKVVLGLR